MVSADLVQSVRSVPMILRDILPIFVPYALTLALFCGFMIWNGGIVLGTYGALGTLCLGRVYRLNVFSSSRRQVKSRAVSSPTAAVLFHCVCNDHGVASADQRG